MTVSLEQRLREIRDEATAIAAKGTDFSDDDGAKFEALLAEADTLKAQKARTEKFGDLKLWMDEPSRAQVQPALVTQTPAGEALVEASATKDGALKAKLVGQFGPGALSDRQIMATTTQEYEDAFKGYLKYGDHLSGTAMKTLQEGQDAEGGYLVTPDFMDTIIQKLATPTRVAARVTQLNTSKDTLVIPRVNYTADDIYTTGVRSTWTSEVPVSSTAMRVTDPVFGQTRIPIYTNMMSIPITMDLVEDSSFDLMGWLASKFAETINLLREDRIINGTGTGQPTGILSNPGDNAKTQPAVVNVGAPINGDGIVSLGFSLPEQYDENAAFIFSKTQTGPVIGKLKDGSGRYLWGAGLQDSGLSPNMHDRKLLGYDVLFSEFMPPPGSNNFPIIFGDLGGYFLVNRVGLSVRVLNEIYAETNQILCLGRVRFGGQTAESFRIKVGKQA